MSSAFDVAGYWLEKEKMLVTRIFSFLQQCFQNFFPSELSYNKINDKQFQWEESQQTVSRLF